ncbi:MAG: hypothetical protein COB42_04695 [Sulfurimonas sp.]|nr:MAG: hypothetical protein COB42_04695 [Sulfurimonas sp.]
MSYSKFFHGISLIEEILIWSIIITLLFIILLYLFYLLSFIGLNFILILINLKSQKSLDFLM